MQLLVDLVGSADERHRHQVVVCSIVRSVPTKGGNVCTARLYTVLRSLVLTSVNLQPMLLQYPVHTESCIMYYRRVLVGIRS